MEWGLESISRKSSNPQPVFNGGAALSNILSIHEWPSLNGICALCTSLYRFCMKQKQATLVRSSQTSLADRGSGLSDIHLYHARQVIAYLAHRIKYNRILLDILIWNLRRQTTHPEDTGTTVSPSTISRFRFLLGQMGRLSLGATSGFRLSGYRGLDEVARFRQPRTVVRSNVELSKSNSSYDHEWKRISSADHRHLICRRKPHSALPRYWSPHSGSSPCMIG